MTDPQREHLNFGTGGPFAARLGRPRSMASLKPTVYAHLRASGAAADLPNDGSRSTPSFYAEFLEHTKINNALSQAKKRKEAD